MKGFQIAILLLLVNSSRARRHVEVLHQVEVFLVEAPLAGAQVVGRGCRVVGLVEFGNALELEEGILNAAAQCDHRLGVTHRHPLPVGIWQHGVAEHVVEGLAGDAHLENIRASKVGLHGLARPCRAS